MAKASRRSSSPAQALDAEAMEDRSMILDTQESSTAQKSVSSTAVPEGSDVFRLRREVREAGADIHRFFDGLMPALADGKKFGDTMLPVLELEHERVQQRLRDLRRRGENIASGQFSADLREIDGEIIALAKNIAGRYNALIPILEPHIEEQEHPNKRILSVQERLALISDYAKQHDEEAVVELIAQFFPSLSVVKAVGSTELPTEAPEIYQGLRGPETPPAFVKRVYGEWLGHGLTRAHIRKLDPTLYTAINNWLTRPGNEWPAEVDLPTLKDQNDRWVQRLRAEGASAALGENASATEFLRLRSAAGRRKGGTPDIK